MWIGGNILYRSWFQLSCQGREYLPRLQGYIIAANHVSHLDGPAIVAAQSIHIGRVHSLAARDYFFDSPLKAWLCDRCLNMIPFRRQGSFRDCLTQCQQLVAKGDILLVFPEGTRSLAGTLQPFKPGLGLLAVQLGVPIVPAYIQGTYQALPKGKLIPRPHPIRVSFGKPIDPAAYEEARTLLDSRQLYRQIVADVRRAVADLRDCPGA